MERLSRVIVDWQISKNILTEEKRTLYLYAYALMVSQVVNVLLAVLIAVVLRSPMPVFVFLASYIPMRSYCGGYHANTSGGCTVVSALLTCMVCWFSYIIPMKLAVILPLAAFAVSGIFIFLFAPVSDKHKRLDEAEVVRYRFRSRLIWFIEAVIGMIFWILKGKACVVIAISHLILSVMLCIGILKNQRDGSYST